MDNESQKVLKSTANRLNLHQISVYEELNYYNPASISEEDRQAISTIGKLSNEERAKFDFNALLEKRWQMELHNRDAFFRLYELFQTCQDTEKAAVLAKLTQFKNHINRFEVFKALRIDWNKYPFKSETPKEAQAAANKFGGEVTDWE